MIRLIRAELGRARFRRTTLVTLLLVLVGVALFQLDVNAQVTPPSAAEVAQNQAYYDQAHQDWVDHHEQWQQECTDQGSSVQECQAPEPTAADYALTATPFKEVAQTAVTVSGYVALLAAFLLSASLIGAEYGSGAVANWLTFVPQRLRVYGSKLIAAALVSGLLGLLANGLTVAAAAVLTRWHGGGLAGLGPITATGGRGVAMAVLAGVAGFTLALVTRHTVAALGLALGLIVASYVQLAQAFQSAAWAAVTPWTPMANVRAFLNHGTTYSVPVETVTADGSSTEFVDKTLSFGHSAAYWLAVLVVLVVGAALVFRRRDVT